MPNLETPSELAEDLADKFGIYGIHSEACTINLKCRMCFTSEMEDRIRQAAKNEIELSRIAAVEAER